VRYLTLPEICPDLFFPARISTSVVFPAPENLEMTA
jgi:hypothetical protein